MDNALRHAILEIARHCEPSGATMGRIVDELTGEGFAAEHVEAAVWHLLGERRLTPCGFVCRKVKRRDATGETQVVRSYEFLLIPWSVDADRQLELELGQRSG